MTGSYGYFIFNFLRNCPIFHSDCTILLSHEELLKVQFLYTLTNTLFFFFCLFDSSHSHGCEVISYCGFG